MAIAELGEAIGPLDGGRLEAAPPKGWIIPPRSASWVVRFKVSTQTTYPTILVTAKNNAGVTNVSKDNVNEFARQVAAHLQETGDAAKLSRAIAPLEVRGRWGILYGRRAKDRGMIVDRLLFETVVSGRKYTFELRALEGEVSKYQPHLLAVISGAKFLDTDAPTETPPEQPDETPPEHPPTEPEEDPFS
jgi:hypothetical protein